MASGKFLGLQYPLVPTSHGVMAQKSDVDQIKADLLQLLLTEPGERVMIPSFGTPLKQLMFEPNDGSLAIQAKRIISDSITTWEPRIVVTDIQVTSNVSKSFLNPSDPGDDIQSILGITISFVDPQNISQVENLVLEVPLGG